MACVYSSPEGTDRSAATTRAVQAAQVERQAAWRAAQPLERPCKDCGRVIPAGDDPRSGRCKDCRNALKRRKWAELTPGQRRAKGHKGNGRELSPDGFAAMSAAQDGRCAICGQRPPERPAGRPRLDGTRTMVSGLHYDHDHATGAGRALLCPSCNVMLGYAQDSPDVLEAGAAYLRTWLAGNYSEQ